MMLSPVSLKDLADLSLDGTHWLLRVAQQEHSCAGVVLSKGVVEGNMAR